MSLSYSAGALSRAWFGCQPLWIAVGSAKKRLIYALIQNLILPLESSLIEIPQPPRAHCIAHTPVPHAAYPVTDTRKCGVIHAWCDTRVV
jgi:hypothetical protein